MLLKVKKHIIIFSIIILSSCAPNESEFVSAYHEEINKAELAICNEDFDKAVKLYSASFQKIHKAFGKDVFNAALASQVSKQYALRDSFLQKLINNSDELEFVKSIFVGKYISNEAWAELEKNRQFEYKPVLRNEFVMMRERDQLFRPMYETHDDTINAIRKSNLSRIIDITNESGFPSQIELGYSEYLRTQNHDIVLHHTAQRRSYDKSVYDLEPLLFQAVHEGRFDPEKAIMYLNFQNDNEKGKFEVYSTWQFQHPLLPDSLNNKLWLIKLDSTQKSIANKKRQEWLANSVDDIALKAHYLSMQKIPFIFSSVRKSVARFREDLTKEEALKQYQLATADKLEYKP